MTRLTDVARTTLACLGTGLLLFLMLFLILVGVFGVFPFGAGRVMDDQVDSNKAEVTWLFIVLILLIIGVFDLWVIVSWGKQYSISHRIVALDKAWPPLKFIVGAVFVLVWIHWFGR